MNIQPFRVACAQLYSFVAPNLTSVVRADFVTAAENLCASLGPNHLPELPEEGRRRVRELIDTLPKEDPFPRVKAQEMLEALREINLLPNRVVLKDPDAVRAILKGAAHLFSQPQPKAEPPKESLIRYHSLLEEIRGGQYEQLPSLVDLFRELSPSHSQGMKIRIFQNCLEEARKHGRLTPESLVSATKVNRRISLLLRAPARLPLDPNFFALYWQIDEGDYSKLPELQKAVDQLLHEWPHHSSKLENLLNRLRRELQCLRLSGTLRPEEQAAAVEIDERINRYFPEARSIGHSNPKLGGRLRLDEIENVIGRNYEPDGLSLIHRMGQNVDVWRPQGGKESKREGLPSDKELREALMIYGADLTPMQRDVVQGHVKLEFYRTGTQPLTARITSARRALSF